MRRSFFLFLLTVLLVSGGLRYYHLSRLPAGGVHYASEQYTPAAEPKVDLKDVQVLAALDSEYTKLVAAVIPSVVCITSSRTVQLQQAPDALELFFNFRRNRTPLQQEQSSLGSGVIVSHEGHIITNNHVIADMQRIQVQLTDGRVAAARLIGTDEATDIAVLKIDEKNLEPLSFGDSDEVRVGQLVFAIGNPFGLQETVTQGIISAKGRRAIADSGVEFLQTDAAVNSGNSGGPLLNLRGQIVGINSAIYSGPEKRGAWLGISFAIPANTARHTLESLLKTGRVVRGYLGVRMAPLNREIARLLKVPDTAGVAVVDVVPGSPAEKAGLKAKDVVRTFAGKAVADPIALTSRIAEQPIGSQVELGILRDGKEMTLTATVAEMPGSTTIGNVNPTQPPTAAGEANALTGVSVSEMPPRLRTTLPAEVQGVVVSQIAPESTAAEVLHAGDLIEAINQTPVRNVTEYERVARALPGEDRAVVQIVRGRSRLTVVVP